MDCLIIIDEMEKKNTQEDDQKSDTSIYYKLQSVIF